MSIPAPRRDSMVVVRQHPLYPHHIALCLLSQDTTVDSFKTHLLLVVPGLHVSEVCLKGVYSIDVLSTEVGTEAGDSKVTLEGERESERWSECERERGEGSEGGRNGVDGATLSFSLSSPSASQLPQTHRQDHLVTLPPLQLKKTQPAPSHSLPLPLPPSPSLLNFQASCPAQYRLLSLTEASSVWVSFWVLLFWPLTTSCH